MSNNNETVISYRVDGRGLSEARRQIQSAFKPDVLKAYGREATNVAKTLGAMASAAKDFNKQTAEVGKAAKAYVQLGQALGGVATAYGRIKQSTTSYGMGTPGQRSGANIPGGYAAQPAQPPGPSRFGQGFWQGLAPTLGQLIGPGSNAQMRQQVIGQYLGSGIRGAGNTMAGMGMSGVGMASGMMGGHGPLSTMFGGIPFIGGAASTAEAMAGSALQNYQARLGAAPFISGAVSGGKYVGGKYVGGTPATTGMDASALLPSAVRNRSRERSQLVEGTQRGLGSRIGESVNPFSGIANNLANDQADDIAKTAAQAAVDFQQRRSLGAAVSGQHPATKGHWVSDPNTFSAVGSKLGMDETSSVQLAGQLGHQIGGRGAMDPGRFAQILGAQTMGVDNGAAAGIFRQIQSGRGGATADRENVLARVISDAMRTGLDNSEVSEYLENISSLQEQASTRGVRLSTEGVSGLASSIAGTGVGGLQGMRLAGQFVNAGQGVAEHGVRGAVDVQLARSFGYDPGKPGSYLDALRGMESPENMTPGKLKSFVGRLTAGVSDPKAKSFMLKRALSQIGVTASFEQTDKLAAGDFSAGLSGPGMSGKDLSGRLDSAAVKEMTGALRSQAGIQNTLLAAGKESLPVVQRLEGSAARLAQAMGTLEPTLDKYIASPISGLSDLIAELIRALGGAGLNHVGQ